jgi:hypothetical protein
MVSTAMRLLVLLAGLHSAGAFACIEDKIRYEPRSFLGYSCADDCERHKAGFAVAARRGIRNVAECREVAAAEAEGCRAWVEEGVDANAAGYRWALENEITSPCLCDGAGREFRAGCLRYLGALLHERPASYIKVILAAGGQTHVLRATMKELEDMLDPQVVQRVHRRTGTAPRSG